MAIGPILPDFVVVALDNDVLNDWRFRKPATLKAINEYIGLVKALRRRFRQQQSLR